MGLAKPSSPPSVSLTPAAAPTPRILIADDCAGTREVVAQMFGATFESITLDNGTSAWERIQSDTSIVAVITDLDMPGLDGYQLIAQVRGSTDARVRELPIIAITGAVDNETRRRVFVSGATGLITKPIDRNQLLALARVYFRLNRPESVGINPPAAPSETVVEAERAPEQTDVSQHDYIDFDVAPAVTDSPAEPLPEAVPVPTATTAAPTPEPTDSVEQLSVSELEALIQQEVRPPAASAAAERAVSDTNLPVQTSIPVELISIDAALQAIADGRSALLIPYLKQLEQRIQPLLNCYRKRYG